MSILNTDLIFGPDPSHVVHYMQQCAMTSKIQAPFLSQEGNFKPISQADLTRAIVYARDTGLSGQWAVRGEQNVTPKQLMNIVEQACGKQEG